MQLSFAWQCSLEDEQTKNFHCTISSAFIDVVKLTLFWSAFQELELKNSTKSLEESLSGVVRDQCSCNFTSVNLEDSKLTCSDDSMRAVFTTTVVYSSNSGDVTATNMINALKRWAAINGADALVQIDGTNATVIQVCSSSCKGPSSSGDATAGPFIGGLITGIVLVAIPVAIVW